MCHHSVCLVLFHKKYGYGKAEKEYEHLSKLALNSPDVILSEIGTTGTYKYMLTYFCITYYLSIAYMCKNGAIVSSPHGGGTKLGEGGGENVLKIVEGGTKMNIEKCLKR